MVVIIKFKFSAKVFLEVAFNNIEYNIMLNILSKLVLVQNLELQQTGLLRFWEQSNFSIVCIQKWNISPILLG